MLEDRIKINLDGRWDFEELTNVTRDYIKLYGFSYSLIPHVGGQYDGVYHIYRSFPWMGGFSTVHFFNRLFDNIPIVHRPEVKRIQYASPGFIELSLVLEAAIMVAGVVSAVCFSLRMASKTYRGIQKGAIDHKLSKINLANSELDLKARQIEFCRSASQKMEALLRLSDEQVSVLDNRVQGNVVMKLKILLSVYRRAERLAEKQEEGKLKVGGGDTD